MTSIAALSNTQFGRGWNNPSQLQGSGSMSMSMADLATSNPVVGPSSPLQKEQSWSGELQAIRSNWDESSGSDALGASSATTLKEFSRLDVLSRATKVKFMSICATFF